jgi:predicted Zn finger-like uncharacterized protein
MNISCNECDATFSVDDSLIKDTGSKVRCSKCNSVFLAYPQPLETDESEELSLEGLDTSSADLEEDDGPLDTEDLLDELELDLDDFNSEPGEDDGLESEGPTDDIDGELELDLDLDDDDDADLDIFDETDAGDELPDLSDFEDLAGLDDDSLAMDEEPEDLNLELENETDVEAEIDETSLEFEDDEELDLTNLDFEEDDNAEAEVAAAADSEDLGFGLELDQDDEAQADGEMAEAGAEVEDTDQLDLSDLELELDEAFASDDTTAVASDDLDLDLEVQAPGQAETADAGSEIEDADELDLSDLELEFDEASTSDDTKAVASDDLDLDLEEQTPGQVGMVDAGAEVEDADELDLNLDLEEEAEAIAGGRETDADELDLSDLEEIIDSKETPGDQSAGLVTAEELELDFDLETDEVAQTTDANETAAGNTELDLSDLDQILETDDTPNAEAAADNDADELDLQFDIDGLAAEGAKAPAEAEVSGTAPDDDLLDIEKMLEQGDDTAPDIENGEEEDLSLTMEAALDDASKVAEQDLDLDFDIESELQEKEEIIGGLTPADEQMESNLLDANDVDFLNDSGIEDESQIADVVTDQFATDEFTDTRDDYGQTDVLQDFDDEMPEAAVAAKSAKLRSKKPVVAVLLILLLAIGAIIIPKSLGIKIPYLSDIKIPYLSDMDIKIPYLSDWLNPKEQDVAGNLKIAPMSRTISGKFVNHSKVGRLFIIHGKIKNEYDHPRSFVKITAKLYKKGQKLAKSTTVYCGNVISESDLKRMDIAAINKRMKNKYGIKRSNLKIKTGKMVPFMIVFDKLPNNLDEYTVEVASSSI